MGQMKNIGVRLSDELFAALNDRCVASGEDKSDICRNAIAVALGVPVENHSPVVQLQQINDRLCRIEAALRICPSENRLEDGSENSPAQLDGQELPEIVHLPLSMYVNEENLIICPHCGSLDSDWAKEYPEDATVKAISCHQCGKRSTFDMSR